MPYSSLAIWKEAPFIRLMIPLVTGIIIEWYIGLPIPVYKYTVPVSFLLVIIFSFLRSFTRFQNYWLSGLLINTLLISVAGWITSNKDIRNDSNCITRWQHSEDTYVVTLAEPPVEKERSFKSVAAVRQIVYKNTVMTVKGNIIIYFQKDSSLNTLTYNSRLCFRKKLQPVKNSGNPGAFDYERYCIFQQTYYQVYLKAGDFTVLPGVDEYNFNTLLFKIRKGIVTILHTFIAGKKEAGLAEALLIGYKDDLDKTLVQSYSNTGVVHIIAISGLHLGLIYWLLNLLLHPLKMTGRSRFIKAILIISGLWLFSILTGGSASVCRSALMFTFIVTGENIERKTNVYNSLAASAFVLLCYNPYWLWDAGFQLSYIAVLSIIIFMKPVYNWFYIKNKLLDQIWKMAAISIAAQILTTPVSIFHFQQFPNYFLITNLVAVPLSSLVVLAEIGLCTFSFLTFLATPIGSFTYWLIKIMNGYIEYINKMPLTVTDALHLSLPQLMLVYLVIGFISVWIFQKNKNALLFALSFIVCFCILKCCYVIKASQQQLVVVYNVPHKQAIDLIEGSQCLFIGDSSISHTVSLQNFILKPSRNKFRIKSIREARPRSGTIKVFRVNNKRVLMIEKTADIHLILPGSIVDVIIVSGNPDISISGLQKITGCKRIIFDSSTSVRKLDKWKVDCEKADISFYSVTENGAFILNLN